MGLLRLLSCHDKPIIYSLSFPILWNEYGKLGNIKLYIYETNVSHVLGGHGHLQNYLTPSIKIGDPNQSTF